MNYGLILKTSVFLLAMVAVGCTRRGESAAAEEDVLVTAGDSSLMLEEVLRQIPSGLAASDSAEMFSRIVERWIENRVLEDVAEENVIDLEKINRMADDYRKRLIIDDYLRRKREAYTPRVDESEIRAYYDRHIDEFILTQPLVKGIYIKTSEKDDRLGSIRRWMMTATDASVDDIEKYGMRMAMKYEYFEDKWVEWSVVADQIPYRFYDADAFLRSTKDFETQYEGSVYLLHISDYLPSGSKEPYEYASVRIAGILSGGKTGEYMNNLRQSIYREAVKKGKLKPGLYDPLKGEMKESAPSGNKINKDNNNNASSGSEKKRSQK